MITPSGPIVRRIAELLNERSPDRRAQVELIELLHEPVVEEDADVLDDVIGLLRGAVEAAAAEPVRWRLLVLEELGDALTLRFWQGRRADPLDDLNAAIDALRSALAIASGSSGASDADHRAVCAVLGDLLHTRFRYLRSDPDPDPAMAAAGDDDLDSAISLLTRAVSGPEPDRFAAADLGAALADRYDLGADDDRDAAIEWLRRAYDAADPDPDPDTDTDVGVDAARLAELLLDRGEALGDVDDLTSAIGYARARLAELPDDSSDHVLVRYLLGSGHLLRAQAGSPHSPDALADLRSAVDHLREALALPSVPYPSHGEVAAVLGMALGVRLSADATKTFPAPPAELIDEMRDRSAEAIRLLTAARSELPVDDPLRARVRFHLGLARALRFLVLGGGADDRAAALAELAAMLDFPGLDPAMADLCHYNIALIHLTYPMPEDLRRSVERYDFHVQARLAALGESPDYGPTPEDARSALRHLAEISAETEAVSAQEIIDMRNYALLCRRADGPSDEVIDRAVRDADEAVRLTTADDPDLAMRRGFLGAWIRLRAERSGRPDDVERSLEELAAAAEGLDRDDRMSPLLLSVIGESLGLPGSEARSPEDGETVVALLERVLRQMPDAHPARAETLTHLGRALLRQVRFDNSPGHFDRVRRLLAEAIARPTAGPANEAVNHYLLAMVDFTETYLGSDIRVERLDGVVERLKHAAGLVPAEHQLRLTILGALSIVYDNRYMREGGLEFQDAANYYARMVLRIARENGESSADVVFRIEHQLAVAPVFRDLRRPSRADVDQAIERLNALGARLPEDDDRRSGVARHVGMLRLLRTGIGPDGRLDERAMRADPENVAAASEAMAAAFAGVHRDDKGYPLALALAGNARAGQGYARRNVAVLDEGLAMLRDAWAAARALAPDRQWWPNLPGAVSMLGIGLRLRYELTRDRADLNNAIDRLEEAHRIAAEQDGARPVGRGSAQALGNLARAYYERADPRRHDRRRAAELGIEVLRARAVEVLLQTTTERAFETAAATSAETIEIARWCLAAGRTTDAVEALERGRAMVLHAATRETRISALLRETGQDELAAEWEDAARTAPDPAPWDLLPAIAPSMAPDVLAHLPAARVPSDLRHRVVAALDGTEIGRNVLAPPSIAEIAGALRTAAAAALVYLIPADRGGPGMAVVVDAHEKVHEISLPSLTAGPRGRVEAFATAQRDRALATPGTREADRIRGGWDHALGDLCDWAWRAAMERILADLRGPSARVLLVPVGELGAVPWHAARRRVAADGYRYACQDAIISYAASARQFVDACAPGRRGWQSAAALVRVGGAGLYWASKEIEEIHRRHYSTGRLLGGRRRRGARPSSPATAGNVRELLPGPGSAGASLLHLGCHARPAPRPVDSSLELVNGESLSMTEVLDRARARPGETPGGLVILAACGSDLTASDHDEALTLATAFLAGGAVGAVGARWPVDDVPTALFMTMFHHYLNSGYDGAATALRAAQLWMLDPARRLPPETDPSLTDELTMIDLAAPAAWAAFVYQGR